MFRARYRRMLLSPKYLPRLIATVGLFTRYGLRDVAARHGLLELVPDDEALPAAEEREMEEHARAFADRLVELGPAYVKLGQIMSTRPDMLPPPYIEALTRLQDHVPPLPTGEVECVIEEELGARLGALFATFDPEPLGSASLGQVHAATLRDGREVAVKVQRPGIREALAEDLEFFNELARFLTEHTKTGNRLDLAGVVRQAERALADELDYRTEARSAATLRRNLAEFPHILIPRVIEAYTTSRVLTTERVHGRKVDDIPPIARVEYDFAALADELARAYLQQITVDGFFHADPHPGNIFIVLPHGRDVPEPATPAELAAQGDVMPYAEDAATSLGRIEQEARERAGPPAAPDDPRIALIDFGMTARLSERLRGRVVRLLASLADNRGEDAAETLIALGAPREEFDRAGYVRDVAALVAENVDRPVSETSTGRLLYAVIDAGFEHGLTLPTELTMLAKAIFNLDAATRALDPSFNAADTVREFATRIADHQAQRDFSPRQLLQAAFETSELLRVLPHRLDTITHRMAANEFALRLDTPQLTHELEGMQKIANRIFTGLVLAGLLVASGLLMPYQHGLGLAGFVVAAVIGLYMVITILVSDRRARRGGAG